MAAKRRTDIVEFTLPYVGGDFRWGAQVDAWRQPYGYWAHHNRPTPSSTKRVEEWMEKAWRAGTWDLSFFVLDGVLSILAVRVSGEGAK